MVRAPLPTAKSRALAEQRGELRFASGHARDAALASRGGRGVDAEHGQAMALDLAADVRRRMVVGDLQLDGLEARCGGGTEPRRAAAVR